MATESRGVNRDVAQALAAHDLIPDDVRVVINTHLTSIIADRTRSRRRRARADGPSRRPRVLDAIPYPDPVAGAAAVHFCHDRTVLARVGGNARAEREILVGEPGFEPGTGGV